MRTLLRGIALFSLAMCLHGAAFGQESGTVDLQFQVPISSPSFEDDTPAGNPGGQQPFPGSAPLNSNRLELTPLFETMDESTDSPLPPARSVVPQDTAAESGPPAVNRGTSPGRLRFTEPRPILPPPHFDDPSNDGPAPLLPTFETAGNRLPPPAPDANAPLHGDVSRVRVVDATALEGLPNYAISLELDTTKRRATVEQKVRWTNPGPAPTKELVFHVIPNSRPDKKLLFIAERTVESLRLDPRTCIDREGRRFHLEQTTLLNHSGEPANQFGQQLSAEFDEEHDTHLHIALPHEVQPGQTVEVQINYWLDLPQLQGRLGQYKSVTNLLNWYPVLAVYGVGGWDAVPFVPWHQPWLNEAGNYQVRMRVSPGQEVATGGRIVHRAVDTDGFSVLDIRGEGLRDFTIVASDRFDVYETDVDGIHIRVLAFPEHQGHARLGMQIATECLRQYSQWFGPYAYREFELVESYFGWNGNESSGLVMIDERILDAPQLAARYVEHLVSHEICHQWWYSAVGTDGYREPWVDEGFVQWLTRVRLEDKYGPDPKVFDLPGLGPLQLPNIPYRNLIHSGYALYHDRGGNGNSLASLDEIGHLHNLFFLVYDRGARIVGMIHHRLGRERFFEFMRRLYSAYRFRILRANDIQRELEAFTGESWEKFFDDWLRSGRDADWKMGDVKVSRTATGYRTEARLIQTDDINEPVDVSFQFKGREGSARERVIRIDESHPSFDSDSVDIIHASATEWLVAIESTTPPDQITIDPDGWVLDTNPRNNSWKPEIDFRISPFYTPLDEVPLTQPWEGTGLVAGFGVDSEGRIGFRSALVAPNDYRVSPFIAYSAAGASNSSTANGGIDYVSAGVDTVFYNVPAPNWQLGARYEYAFLTNAENDPGDQAKVYLRKVLQYTTSLIYPNLSYFDIYTRFGDNFFPDSDGRNSSRDPRVQNYRHITAMGLSFHADSQLPYWDPDTGFRLDANYEHGFRAFEDNENYDRVDGQFAVVRRLPDGLGWLSNTKLAGRAAGGYGWQVNGEHFRLGGPTRFRGRRADTTEGNAFWVGTAEWRFPLTGDLDLEVADNFAALRSIDSAIFYDVGQSYLFDQAQGPADHAIGLGFYFDIPLLSFVENLTIRTEIAHSLTNDTDVYWFGLYRAF